MPRRTERACVAAVAVSRIESTGRPTRGQPRQANQVVRGSNEVTSQTCACQPAKARPSEAAHHFHPTEDLFDSLANPLAGGVARVTRCPSIDSTATTTGVLRHVRRDALLSQIGDALTGVVVLVAGQCARMKATQLRILHQLRHHVAVSQPTITGAGRGPMAAKRCFAHARARSSSPSSNGPSFPATRKLSGGMTVCAPMFFNRFEIPPEAAPVSSGQPRTRVSKL